MTMLRVATREVRRRRYLDSDVTSVTALPVRSAIGSTSIKLLRVATREVHPR
jgi:hypothetical protein